MIKPLLKTDSRLPKTEKKRKKKSSTQKLRSECDRLYQELGRKMYSSCFCGKVISCLHHYHPKSTSSGLRYEIKNGVPICAGCHIQHHAKNDPDIQAEMILFMKEKWGENWEIELRQQRQILMGIKTDKEWYLTHKEMLEEMIMAYKDEPKIEEDNF